MALQQNNFQPDISYEIVLKIKDIEESNKLMKERIMLIGQNLIETHEKNREEITNLKKSIYNLETDMKRIKNIIESLSEEIAKSARKEELAILSKQYKMFEPLKYARIEDIEKIVENKLKKDAKNPKEKNNSKEETSNEKPRNFWRDKL